MPMRPSSKRRRANRFARELIVQETGHRMLKAQGIEIIAYKIKLPSAT